MTAANDHLQHLFRTSSGGAEQIDFKALAAARRANAPGYWDVARTIETVTAGILEEMMPRVEIPSLTDGTITYRFQNIMEEMRVSEREISTSAASKAQQFKDLLERLETEDPAFLQHYFETMAHWNVMDIVIPLHVSGVHENLKTWLMNTKGVHIDDVVLAVNRSRDKFLDNEYLHYDYELTEVMSNIVASYVTYKLGDLKKDAPKPSEDDVTRLLQISTEHGLTPYALQVVNLKAPLPASLLAVHDTGCKAFRKTIETDLSLALEFADLKKSYATLSGDQKLAMGQKFLNHLAASYGFHPPPELSHEPGSSTYGGQSVWDAKDKEACFAHPLGKISFRDFPESHELYIHLLSHEFIHGMEDAALFTLNPEFQSWKAEAGAEVRLGEEATVKNLRSAALQISFNTASDVPALKGIKSVAFKAGDYYSGDHGDDPAPSKEQDLYANQLRERHAYGLQGVIARTFFNALKLTEVSRDPLTAVIRGQNGMFAAEELLATKLGPVIPADLEASFSRHLAEVKADFKQADARETGYAERLFLLNRALLKTQSLAINAYDDGLIDLEQDKETGDLFDRIFEAKQFVLQGKRLLAHSSGQASGSENKPTPSIV